ncbi:hypothetical protein ACMD2_24117 [Ananas comosus]|uniref:Uncharacterized protein n=2 Tax=Ananas comosus TaxID=4615 RepID=A0A199V719_ANACO|nr:hypothetical protein ACMD2_24117 [Ananas comosus]
MMDDLLDSDLGKHDYDWLLTPPGTPHNSSLDLTEMPLSSTVPKRAPARSSSAARASRFSASQPENSNLPRLARSSSLSRPSTASTFIPSKDRTSILNTSSASVNSRPSTPIKRVGTLSSTRPTTTPASRPVPTRSPTPVRTQALPTSAAIKTRPSQNARSSTPSTRPRVTPTSNSNSNSSVPRSTSRPSTPTRHPIIPGRSPSVGQIRTSGGLTSTGRSPIPSGQSSAPSSRPSSPSPRPRTPVRPLDIPDFPTETPPNLKTKLPERPVSAGRARPGMALTVRSSPNSEPAATLSSHKRISLPVVTRNKFPENISKVPLFNNGQQAMQTMMKATENSGFGRTISKKSLDMAIRHMDIRQNIGGIRSTSLFPRSIRSSARKHQPARTPDSVIPNEDELLSENGNSNGTVSGDSNRGSSYNGGSTANNSPDRENLATKDILNEIDIYGSFRYDSMLLREDVSNTNWLHSVDDKSDESSVFDHRLEPLPEPFGPL